MANEYITKGCSDGAIYGTTEVIPIGAKISEEGIEAPGNAREVKVIFPANFTGGNCEIRESLDGGVTWNTVNMPGAADDTDKRKISSAAAASETVLAGFMLFAAQPKVKGSDYVPVRYGVVADTNQVAASSVKWHFWMEK